MYSYYEIFSKNLILKDAEALRAYGQVDEMAQILKNYGEGVDMYGAFKFDTMALPYKILKRQGNCKKIVFVKFRFLEK